MNTVSDTSATLQISRIGYAAHGEETYTFTATVAGGVEIVRFVLTPAQFASLVSGAKTADILIAIDQPVRG